MIAPPNVGSSSVRRWLVASLLINTLVFASVPADACLLAVRLRAIAPHLSDAEVMQLAHGSMSRDRIAYSLRQPFACSAGMADIFECSNVDLDGFLTPEELVTNGSNPTGSDIWGWTDLLTGSEYALIGLSNGTSFVDVSNPQNPIVVGFLPTHQGQVSSWRDVKTYRDHAFIVADELPSHGMQIFDLTRLRGAAPGTTFSADYHYDGINSAHNVVINEASGYAYLVGGDRCAGGLEMANIQDPANVTDAGCYSSDGYTHDAQCVIYRGPDVEHQGKELCFASNEDTLTIVDVSDKASPQLISRTGYLQPGEIGYVHQGWLTDDHQFFFQDDELDERFQDHTTRTYIWNVQDLDAPTFNSWDADGQSLDHNQYVRGDYVFQANYKRGLRLLSIDNAATGSLSEVGYFDTFPSTAGNPNGFNGAWSVYPFFTSGTVIVSDITRGLFILSPRFPEPPFFEDGFETGDTDRWTEVVP